jgi:hypothetical protein
MKAHNLSLFFKVFIKVFGLRWLTDNDDTFSCYVTQKINRKKIKIFSFK